MNTSHYLRSLFSKTLVAAIAILACENVHATLLFEDGFNYPVGGLGTSDVAPNGNAWSSGSSRITVVNGNLTYNGLQDLGGNSVQDIWNGSAGSVVNTYTAQTSGNIY